MTPGGAPAPHGARQRLPGRADRRRARQLLPRGQPRRAARARPALGRRPRRRGAAGVPRAARDRPPVGDARARARRAHRRGRRRPPHPSGRADGRARARRPRRASTSAPRTGSTPAPTTGLGQQRALVEQLGGVYREFVGEDVGEALVSAARSLNATQIVLGATRRSRWSELTRGSVINRVIRESGVGIDVHVISIPAAEDDRDPDPSWSSDVRGRASFRPGASSSVSASPPCCSRLLGVALTHLRDDVRPPERPAPLPARRRASSPPSEGSGSRSPPRSRRS